MVNDKVAFIASEIDEETLKKLETMILQRASISEEIIISKNGFNNRLGNVTAHDINLNLVKDGDDTYIEVKNTHYLDTQGEMYVDYSAKCNEIFFQDNTLFIDDRSNLDNCFRVSFMEKRVTEFSKYYRNFTDFGMDLRLMLAKHLAGKGYILMSSLSGFYPEYFADGELTMKRKVLFKNIHGFEVKMSVDQPNPEVQPTYTLEFQVIADVNGRPIEQTWNLDNITNISILPNNSIVIYRLTGSPVYMSLGGAH